MPTQVSDNYTCCYIVPKWSKYVNLFLSPQSLLQGTLRLVIHQTSTAASLLNTQGY